MPSPGAFLAGAATRHDQAAVEEQHRHQIAQQQANTLAANARANNRLTNVQADVLPGMRAAEISNLGARTAQTQQGIRENDMSQMDRFSGAMQQGWGTFQQGRQSQATADTENHVPLPFGGTPQPP